MFQNKKITFNKTFLFVLSFLLFANVKVYSKPISPVLTENSVPAENLEEAKQAVWRIENIKGHGGTGFFISPTLFVTNFHNIEKFIGEGLFDGVYLRRKNSFKRIKVKEVLALSVHPDLALLETEPHNSFYLKLKESPLHPEEKLFIVGYPGGSFHIEKNLSLIKKIEDSLLFSFSYPAPYGTSGGPLLDSDGKVLGVFYGVFERSHLIATIYRDLLNSFIEKNKNYPTCKGLDLLKCVDLAVEDIQKKAKEGDFLSQYFLSFIYSNGWLVEKNGELAFYWMKKSAEQGYMIAQYILALMYDVGPLLNYNLGWWTRVDPEHHRKAFAYWLKKSAEQGFAQAQYHLASNYLYGIGDMEKNEKFSFYWMKLAAENGSEKAKYELARMYRDGIGVEKNKELALYWMKQSAEQGYVPAQILLKGMLY